MNQQSSFSTYFAELQVCWKAIAGMCAATIVISIIYIFLLKWITKPLLYISMLLILITFVLLGGYSFLHKDEYEKDSDNYKYALAGAIVSWTIAFAYAICICCCWKNISLGATIMETASEFVSSNIRIVTLPVIAYLIVIPFFIYWFTTAVFLYSIGEVKFKKNSFINEIVWDEYTEYLMWYYLFGLFWVVAFIIGVQ